MLNVEMEAFKTPSIVRKSNYIYFRDGLLYKYFYENSGFEDEEERNITFLLTNNIPNTPAIKDKLYKNGVFVGYIMAYIPKTITFRQGIYADIDYSKKESAIVDVYEGMKALHKHNLYLDDIHSDNFLISEDGKGYLIDLDRMVGKGDEFKFQCLYLVKPNNKSFKINVSSPFTDNIKLMISSLSLLYSIDLEKFIDSKDHSLNLEELYNNVIITFKDSLLDDYFTKIINREPVAYFDEYYFGSKLEKKR